ncbi:MAG: hypothetical protein AAFO29_27310, partial [Actinomycetota bacterium]
MESDQNEDEGQGVDELFESLGIDEVRTWRGREVPGDPATIRVSTTEEPDDAADDRRGVSIPLMASLALAALVVVGGAVWLANRGADDSETAADGGTTEITATGAVGVDETADELMAILASLGLDEVNVQSGEGMIFLTGTVPTEQDLSTLRSAVLDAAEAGVVDLSAVEVVPVAELDEAEPDEAGPDQAAPGPGQPPPPGPGGATDDSGAPRLSPPPGAPPPGFVPPSPEQLDGLQRSLDQVLEETPLVYDVGSSTLNNTQLEVLDTIVIDLLQSHPGVPVLLVGYTDG